MRDVGWWVVGAAAVVLWAMFLWALWRVAADLLALPVFALTLAGGGS